MVAISRFLARILTSPLYRETCTGPGGVDTVIATITTSIETTHFSTFVHTTTGIYTGAPEPTTTEEPEYTSTETETEYGTETETETATEVTDYPTPTDDGSITTYEPVPSMYPTTIEGNATRTGNGTGSTGTPKPHEGSAAGVVVNIGVAGMVAAVLAAVMV